MNKIQVDKRGKVNDIHDAHLLIEMSDRCNHRCIMCKHAWSEKMHGDMPTTFMDPGLFIKIINQLRHSRIKFVSIDPLWAGESLMNPSFKEMISYMLIAIRRYGICRGTVINTNAFFMDKEVADIFLNHGKFVQEHANEGYYFRLYFSLDASTPATYSKIRQVSSSMMGKVIENIDYFMKKRKQMGLVIPNAVFVFIVMEENKQDAYKFMSYWKKYLKNLGCNFEIVPTWPVDTKKDAVYFRQLITPDIKKAIQLHKSVCLRLGLILKEKSSKAKSNKKVLSGQASVKRGICSALWRTPNIQVSGIMTPCCRDIDLTLNLGNVNEQSLDEIWFGPKMQALRQAHIGGDLTGYPVCATCMEPEGEISEEDLKTFRE